jgi:hypothetical protein
MEGDSTVGAVTVVTKPGVRVSSMRRLVANFKQEKSHILVLTRLLPLRNSQAN